MLASYLHFGYRFDSRESRPIIIFADARQLRHAGFKATLELFHPAGGSCCTNPQAGWQGSCAPKYPPASPALQSWRRLHAWQLCSLEAASPEPCNDYKLLPPPPRSARNLGRLPAPPRRAGRPPSAASCLAFLGLFCSCSHLQPLLSPSARALAEAEAAEGGGERFCFR